MVLLEIALPNTRPFLLSTAYRIPDATVDI